MATYTIVPRSLPSSQRVTEITAVAAGDQIDLVEILGRPARRLQFYVTATTDTVEYTLNNLLKMRPQRKAWEALSPADQAHGVFEKSTVDVWSGGAGYPSFSSTGALVLETVETLSITSVQIDALTLGTGTTISIIAW